MFVPIFALADSCERLVSLAPSITETLAALNLSDRIVGKVRYDKISSASDVGGFLDPNIESIAALKPSIVFLLKESSDIGRLLNAISIKTVIVEHRTVKGIFESIDTISTACEVKSSLRTELENKLNKIKERVANLKKVKVLILVRNDGDDSTHSFFVSGSDGYYDELLEFAGGENVFKKNTTALGTISEESILMLNPDIILHFSPPGSDFSPLLHFKQFLISEDYAMIPGPRLTLLAEKMAKTIHPEAYDQALPK